MEAWKSPRKVEEDIRNYRRKRFEHYWVSADMGVDSLAVALDALRKELADGTVVDDDDCPTTPFLAIELDDEAES